LRDGNHANWWRTGQRPGQFAIGYGSPVDTASRAIDCKRHLTVYRIHVELVFLAAIANDFQFHKGSFPEFISGKPEIRAEINPDPNRCLQGFCAGEKRVIKRIQIPSGATLFGSEGTIENSPAF
jgi:hypothetical protein